MDGAYANFFKKRADFPKFKAKWNDKEVAKISHFYPSSKSCHKCGYINQSLTLRTREWICPECNSKLDRDLNAAINILIEEYKDISAGTADYRRGNQIIPSSLVTICETFKIQARPEAHPISFVVDG